MAATNDLDAVRSFAELAQVAVIRVGAGKPAARTVADRARSWLWSMLEPERLQPPGTGMLWLDHWSRERTGWRERAAYLNGDELFGVDYEVCRRCRAGWVEQPATHHEERRRCGLARAALKALLDEHPGLEWHTLDGHLPGSAPFWKAVGDGVPGSYTQRAVCRHKHPGG